MESDTPWSPLHDLDPLDQQVTQALQLDGRASFRRIGEVLGVSDQTVARRHARLRETAGLRVLGLTEPLRMGLTPWFVRVRCTPDAAQQIGDALARRTDTRWVSLLSGGTEIGCLTHVSDPAEDPHALLLNKLPRTPRVVQVTAHALLHVFFGGDLSPYGRLGPLTPGQVAALRPPPPADTTEPAVLDEGDRRLLELLAHDGRTPAAELAAATGWSPTTVRRRMAELRASGVLYFDLDFGPGLHPRELQTALWLEVEPAHLAAVGAALADHTQVAFAAATTGTANVYACLLCRDAPSLYRYLTGPVAALPGVRRTETAPIHRTLKGAGPFFLPNR
ncbi:Lrp/AsnC family transcriptional regulator [Streptomyces sp. NRRL F-5123]|uniref:Lrp/AsnC family transcriptional regulator n=1 Tax=Streptomyces sp. NRRL F-5123 TaxID=1463856 RepID=UPI0005BD92FF|nr:AsnC family transcriptional regulator [Streptomyces sp. NRRL F-5123]